MPWVPDSVPELFFFAEDVFLVVAVVEPPSFLVLISCELLAVVVEAVSVWVVQEPRNATPATQTMEVRMDVFIGYSGALQIRQRQLTSQAIKLGRLRFLAGTWQTGPVRTRVCR